MSDDPTVGITDPLSSEALTSDPLAGETVAPRAVDPEDIPARADDIDPDVVGAVFAVRDRFGAQGLRDLVRLAEQELVVTERALADLADSQDPHSA